MFSIFNDLARWITQNIFMIDVASNFGKGIIFFIEDTTKIYFLLVFMIYVISFLRASLDVERVRDILQKRNKLLGYFLGVFFGAITPFCSCSSIPLFLGFTSAGIPLGMTMSFLITSPMINEVAVILLGSILGWKFTLIYVFWGMIAGFVGGVFIDFIGAERYLMPIAQKAVNMKLENKLQKSEKINIKSRHEFAIHEFKNIFGRVWKWVIIGVGIGAFLHGFIPDGFISENLAGDKWWSVPLAVILGIPLYSNATGAIPVIETLLEKGLPLGTALAFMMSTVAASFPEFVLLRQVMKPKLLLIFFFILLICFTMAGWIFNLMQNIIL